MDLPIPDHVVLGWLASGHSEWLEHWEAWVDAARAVEAAYTRWVGGAGGERAGTHAAYLRALDREQRAAARYADALRASLEAYSGA